ncbi:CinA family protein [Marinivivus vitaminiproducens]|uniref:CinA family protein n=1 Tax=Marinivivus vitaminiproducens TaxID=3035935 RepID=UPI002799ACA0|nr:nicotinamide-nucleotide amidohydrolase family protein [Geminicoccaceae bacterium SCSIO 64248]
MANLDALLPLAERVLAACRTAGLTVATAESCTGGLIVGTLTDIAGSSDVVHAGLVTYSNESKTALLGVPADLIVRLGAVSAEVAAAMAEGARARTGASLAVAVTGIAGPGGGSAAKPVGLVHFGLACAGRPTWTGHTVFAGDRAEVRRATVDRAFHLLLEALSTET